MLFLALLTFLEAAAGVAVAYDGDWKRAMYWILAALMTVSFML
jgi:hypothetical protein